MSLRTRALAFAFAMTGAAIAAIGGGCSSKSDANGARICTPGAYVYCRCQDREEGTKLCHDDGAGFDPCLPCESDTNPEVPPGQPFPDDDAGDAAQDGPPPPVCGDKQVSFDEDCDDGNTDDNDGCDSKCRLSGADAPATRSCPGLPVHVWSRDVTFVSTTIGAPNTAAATLACPSAAGNYPTTGAAANDRIFAVTPHKSGNLTITTSDTDFDNWLYAGTSCTNGDNTYLTCSNKVQGAGGEVLTFPVDANKTYTVFLDGVLTDEGAFRITFSLY